MISGSSCLGMPRLTRRQVIARDLMARLIVQRLTLRPKLSATRATTRSIFWGLFFDPRLDLFDLLSIEFSAATSAGVVIEAG